jgi:hypothetical protein
MNLAYARMVARKHDFGSGRYVTLMVSRLPKNTNGSLFGAELQPQINFACEGVEDGCLIADAKFLQLFPDHSCGAGCTQNWHPLALSDSTTQIQ